MSENLPHTLPDDWKQNIVIGSVAALLEAIILQPTLYWKNALAAKLPLTINPRIIFRGTLASCLNEMQMMAAQFALTGHFQKLMNDNGVHKYVSPAGTEILSSALGGLCPTVLTCPIELVMLQQQKHGGTFTYVLGKVTMRYGFAARGWLRGFLPTIGRDTICTVGMLGVTPIVQKYLMKNHKLSQESSSFYASVIGGVFASVPSHPFDTVKSCMQADLNQKTYTTFSKTTILLYKEVNLTAPMLFSYKCC